VLSLAGIKSRGLGAPGPVTSPGQWKQLAERNVSRGGLKRELITLINGPLIIDVERTKGWSVLLRQDQINIRNSIDFYQHSSTKKLSEEPTSKKNSLSKCADRPSTRKVLFGLTDGLN
jgi:hypothetical protein